jgi:hypothetical protein
MAIAWLKASIAISPLLRAIIGHIASQTLAGFAREQLFTPLRPSPESEESSPRLAVSAGAAPSVSTLGEAG